jgi:outer membrane protein OmpA-like peptidoglycan-associated protein
VSAQGFGEEPVSSNDTPAGQAQNRRVELTLAGSGN